MTISHLESNECSIINRAQCIHYEGALRLGDDVYM